MSGAYAEAMEQKLHEMLDWWEQKLNGVGLTWGPRVVGPHCQLPWHCGWPMRYWKGCSVCRKCGDGGIFEAEVQHVDDGAR